MSFSTGGPRARRTGVALVLLGSVIVGIDAPTTQPARAAAPGRGTRPPTPNILVFVTDDQRARGTLGVMDATRKHFARRGVHFSRSFATTPLCCPSRATIFTGQYTHNHGVKTNSQTDLPQNETIQAYLDAAGYKTAIFGKYLNAWNIDVDPPHFDKWAIFDSSQASYRPGPWNVQGRTKRVEAYPTSFIRRKAMRFLKGTAERRDRRPWSMFLPVPAPHLPSTPQHKHRDASVGSISPNPATREKDRRDKPPYVREKNVPFRRARDVARTQKRSLLSVDDLVGKVMTRLKGLDESRDTLAFFVSDNGFLWAEHKLLGSTASKQNPYNDSVRIPLLARWPGHLQKGAKDRRLAATVDIAPTVMDAVGLTRDPGAPMDGRSLLKDWSRQKILLEFFTYPNTSVPSWGSVRTRRYQYVEYFRDGGGVSFREYYNLNRDPWQLRNLYKDGKPGNDPNTATLSARLDELRECAGRECP